MPPRSQVSDGRLDISARAGVPLAAQANGHSYQPKLPSGASRDQAIIFGIVAVTA